MIARAEFTALFAVHHASASKPRARCRGCRAQKGRMIPESPGMARITTHPENRWTTHLAHHCTYSSSVVIHGSRSSIARRGAGPLGAPTGAILRGFSLVAPRRVERHQSIQVAEVDIVGAAWQIRVVHRHQMMLGFCELTCASERLTQHGGTALDEQTACGRSALLYIECTARHGAASSKRFKLPSITAQSTSVLASFSRPRRNLRVEYRDDLTVNLGRFRGATQRVQRPRVTGGNARSTEIRGAAHRAIRLCGRPIESLRMRPCWAWHPVERSARVKPL